MARVRRTVAGALRDLRDAARLRERAFDTLAHLAPTTEAFLLEPHLAAALRRNRKRLAASHNYVGHAIGLKRCGGAVTRDLAITTFVRKKLSKRQLSRVTRPAAPEPFRSGDREVPTDVVELRLVGKHAAFPGASLGRRVAPEPGTLGFFAHNKNNKLVAVTAGHVGYDAGTYVAPSGSTFAVGPLETSMLSPVDAASVFVQSSMSHQLPNGGTIKAWRALADSEIGTTGFQLYGAASQAWQTGMLLYLADWVEGWDIANGIIHSASTLPGDSGGPVLDLQKRLVGLHLGRGVFEGEDVAIAGSIVDVVKALKIKPVFS